jgi:hypothetical protein
LELEIEADKDVEAWCWLEEKLMGESGNLTYDSRRESRVPRDQPFRASDNQDAQARTVEMI